MSSLPIPTTTLALSPASAADFDLMTSFASSPHGDLVTPVAALTVPGTTLAQRIARCEASTAAQRAQFENDTSAHFVKVVLSYPTTSGSAECSGSERPSPSISEGRPSGGHGEIIALARWHRFASEAELVAHAPVVTLLKGKIRSRRGGSCVRTLPTTAIFSLPLLFPHSSYLHLHCLTPVHAALVLATVVTRPSFRRRGAAGMLVEWGMARAREEGVAAYVDAVEESVGMYVRRGWAEVSGEARMVVDLGRFVGEGMGTRARTVVCVGMVWEGGRDGGGE